MLQLHIVTSGCQSFTHLKFGGSTLDEAADDLLHPLGVPHVDRLLLELRHLKTGQEATLLEMTRHV